MPSFSQLSVFISLVAALAPSVEAHGRGATHRIHFDPHKAPQDHPKAVTLAASTTAPVRDVIVEMFQWSWDSIAQECTNFLGSAGYGYVQVSPPMEHIQGDQWWTDYQPVSYKIQSKHGNRDQFQNMITQCHNAGVKVIADTIFNHMTGGSGTVGTGGSSYTEYDYPGTYMVYDFHTCYHGINNWNNVTELHDCQLWGLVDLKTESDYVRSRLAQYASDLVSLGLDGFRLDAAKHVPVADLQAIISQVNTQGKNLYITQEVLGGVSSGPAGPMHPSDYAGLGHVTEMNFQIALNFVFHKNTSTLASLMNLNTNGWVSSNKAGVYIATHDSERDNNQMNTVNTAHNGYVLANLFMLAQPFGQPTLLSSYSFSNSDQGAPNGGYGTCEGTGGANGWICQHRWIAFAGMVGFHNQVGTSPVTHQVTSGQNRVAFGRGSAGFFAMNNEDGADWVQTFTTSLPDGVYCDVVGGSLSNGQCTGYYTFTVSGGKFKGIVPARGAIAIHTGAKRS